MRKTKIICTLGPATEDVETIEQLILGGMNAARFNFSHGSHESHSALLTRLKNVRDRLGVPIATILDTKGPEIRIGAFEQGEILLEEDSEFVLTTESVPGDGHRVSVTYGELPGILGEGAMILVDDGLIELCVKYVDGGNIVCNVENGGRLSSNKSINLPGISLPLPAVTEKDRGDLIFAAENDFDFVAASFVRRADDVLSVRGVLEENGGSHIKIIAKIENREGVENINEIIEASDAVMIARGDLGVEIPGYEVPVIQKEIIHKAILRGKPVITATQMLDSMIRSPRPTRAEVSDVANAVFDGTSCVMLSGETASGKYPLEALKMMADVVEATEGSINYWKRFQEYEFTHAGAIGEAISHTCCLTARDLEAKAILTATSSGFTARMISRFRPRCPIFALTMTERVRRQLAISWGVYPYLFGTVDSTDRLFSLTIDCAKKEGVIVPGDTVVITAGVPIGRHGTTNLIKAEVVE